jgi:hypothetical protein
MRTRLFPILFGIAIIALVVVGLVRANTDESTQQPLEPGTMSTNTPRPSTPGVTSTPDLEHGDGAQHGDSGPTPTNVPSEGTDHDDHDEVPADQVPYVIDRAGEFWAAFSVRDPKARDKALSKVAAPYLAKKMSVSATYRIPVVKPKRTAVVAGSYSLAVAVTEDTTGTWWYATFILDPIKDGQDAWNAQEYQKATPRMIADAQQILDKPHKR